MKFDEIIDDLPEQRMKPLQPPIDPASGHSTARLALSAGHAREAGYASLKLRPAYHDLLDPPAGYRQGAHIDFLDSEIRLDEEQKRLRLERLSAVDIDSLATLDIFFKPISWYFGLGWRQAAVNGSGAFSDIEHHGVAYIDGGAGYSLQLGDSGQCYLQLGMDIEAGPSLDRGWRTGIGPRTGCLAGNDNWRMRIQSDLRWRNAPDGLEHQLKLELQRDLVKGHALRIQTGLLHADRKESLLTELGWIHYF